MNLDVEDVLAGAVGGVIGRSLLFAAAVWTGCCVGATGLIAGDIAGAGFWKAESGFWLWASPMFLVSYWGIPNLAFLLVSLTYFVLSERPGFLAWGIVAGVESLIVMAGWAGDYGKNSLGIACAWLVWAVLLIMLETGVWLFRAIVISRWARRLGLLRAANAQRNAAKRSGEPAADRDHHDPQS